MVSDPVAGFADRALLLVLSRARVLTCLSSALRNGDREEQTDRQNEPRILGFVIIFIFPAFFQGDIPLPPLRGSTLCCSSPSPSGLGYVISRLRRWDNAARISLLPIA